MGQNVFGEEVTLIEMWIASLGHELPCYATDHRQYRAGSCDSSFELSEQIALGLVFSANSAMSGSWSGVVAPLTFYKHLI